MCAFCFAGHRAAMMTVLDLHHLVIFDASKAQGAHSATGNTNLSPEVVQVWWPNDHQFVPSCQTDLFAFLLLALYGMAVHADIDR